MKYFKGLLAVALVFAMCGLAFAAEPTGKIDPATLYLSQYVSSTIVQRPLSNFGYSLGITYGSEYPTLANSFKTPQNGEMALKGGVSGGARLGVFDSTEDAWDEYAVMDDSETITGARVFSGTVAMSGDVSIATDEDDLITALAPIKIWSYRDDFCGSSCIQNDWTVCSGTDTEINFIKTMVNPFGYYMFVEQTLTLQQVLPLLTGACGIDVSGDVTEDDGFEIKFVHEVLDQVHIIQAADTASTFYFELSLTIATINSVDGDLAFGLMVPEAQVNPPQHDGLNTYFIATLSDNAGDLDFEADVDGGGEVNDDSGITWADGQTKVVRFEINTDGYAAYVDGVAITLTNCNATGANDFTDLDGVIPFYYHTEGAAGTASGIVINFVEWGLMR